MNLHKISKIICDFIAPTSKIQIAVTMCLNFVMVNFCESTDESLSSNMMIIFFGCLVSKIIIIQFCIFYLKFSPLFIKFYEYVNLHQISRFLRGFITLTLKINISVIMGPNFVIIIFCESINVSLSNDMLNIFLKYVVEKRFILNRRDPDNFTYR